jgi:hypothetical protein
VGKARCGWPQEALVQADDACKTSSSHTTGKCFVTDVHCEYLLNTVLCSLLHLEVCLINYTYANGGWKFMANHELYSLCKQLLVSEHAQKSLFLTTSLNHIVEKTSFQGFISCKSANILCLNISALVWRPKLTISDSGV